MKTLRLLSVLFAAFLCCAVSVSAQNVGQVITVTSHLDSRDAVPGDGICSDTEGRCTLRAAIDEANAEPIGRDIIIFSVPLPTVIDLMLGPVEITGNGLSIVGPGARRAFVQRFTGGDRFPLFRIPNQGTTVAIRGLSISDGWGSESEKGGGVWTGPGTTVFLADVALRNHTAGRGAAIYNEGQMFISRVTMQNNVANVHGGAIATAPGSVTKIVNSTITGNSTNIGGGIYAEGQVLCVNCTVTHNAAATSASGIRSGSANEVALLNTIVGSGIFFPVTSLSGSFLSHGNNIVTDARTSTGFANGVNNDQVSDNNAIDPLLGPFTDNGGQTDTRALLNGSPAIDAGNSCVYLGPCPMFGQQEQIRLFWDQRVNHSRGGIFNPVDIGAFESNGGTSVVSSGFGIFTAPNIRAFLYNSQAILTNVETGGRTYQSIGPSGMVRVTNLPAGVVHVLEVKSKRSGIKIAPRVVGFPDDLIVFP